MSQIDCNKLMVDDIISIDGVIDRVSRKNIYGILCGEYDIKPIEIDHNFLEKNGWKWSDINNCWIGKISLRTHFKKFLIGWNDLIIEVSYVHELQHVLVMLGYTEFADNLKI